MDDGPAQPTDRRRRVKHFLAGQQSPFLCAVCNRSSSECKRCSGCKSVSYCSPAHQQADWSTHKLVCKTIKTHVLERATPLTAADSPMTVANELLRLSARPMQYALDAEAAAFAQVTITRLPRCVECGAFPAAFVCECDLVGYCATCNTEFNLATGATAQSGNHPRRVCKALFATARAMRIVSVEGAPAYSFAVSPFHASSGASAHHDPKVVFAAAERDRTERMEVAGDVHSVADGWRGYATATGWLPALFSADSIDRCDPGMRALIFDTASPPLTVFAGIMTSPQSVQQQLRTRVDAERGLMVVHVVGAVQEALQMAMWEELLHLFAAWGVRRLAVGFIGPEDLVATNQRQYDTTVVESESLCGDCKSNTNKCTLSFFFYHGTYEDFARDKRVTHEFSGTAQPPTITVALNPGFHDQPVEWSEGVRTMFDQRACLHVMTAYTAQEAALDLVQLDGWINRRAAGDGDDDYGLRRRPVIAVVPRPNPFRSPLWMPEPSSIGVNFTSNHTLWCLWTA